MMVILIIGRYVYTERQYLVSCNPGALKAKKDFIELLAYYEEAGYWANQSINHTGHY